MLGWLGQFRRSRMSRRESLRWLRMRSNNFIAMQAKEIESTNSMVLKNPARAPASSPSSTSSSAHALLQLVFFMCYGNTSASPRIQLALLQASVLELTETEIPPRRRTKSTSKATASTDKSKTKTTTTIVEIAKKSRPKISPPKFHLSLSLPGVAGGVQAMDSLDVRR